MCDNVKIVTKDTSNLELFKGTKANSVKYIFTFEIERFYSFCKNNKISQKLSH